MPIEPEPAPVGRTYVQSVTIPLKSQNSLKDHTIPMTEFTIDYQTRRDDKGKEIVCKVYLPPIPQRPGLVPAGTASMPSMTTSLQSRNLLRDRKRRLAEFKIDYQTRRDDRGKESVYKVYLPSIYKGWAFIAEKKDVTIPEPEEVPPVAVTKSKKHVKDNQKELTEDVLDVQAPTTRKRVRQNRTNAQRLASFTAVNGVVKPSKLKPGQPPITNPWMSKRDRAASSAHERNKRCPICGDCYTRIKRLQNHFVHCVHRNGNPQGYFWDDASNEERRTGKEVAELYCTRDSGRDHHGESSTPEESFDDDYRPSSRAPSKSSRSSRSLSPPSTSMIPGVRPDCKNDDGATPQTRPGTDHDHRNSITEICGDEITDGNLDALKIRFRRPAETSLEVEQVTSFIPINCRNDYMPQGHTNDQLRETQAQILPLKHDVNTNECLKIAPDTPSHHENEGDTIVASRHDDIPDDFDAAYVPPTKIVLSQESQEQELTSNACNLATPLIAGEMSTDRSLGPSPGVLIHFSPVNIAERQVYRPLPPSRQPAGTKRQTPSEPVLLAQNPKRQRKLLCKPPSLPEDNASTEATRPSRKQKLKPSTSSAEVSVVRLPRNGPTHDEMKDDQYVRKHQYEEADVRIKTPTANSAVPPPLRKEPMRGEKLYADCTRSYETFRKELNELIHELCAANQRATDELRAHDAEMKAYWAHFASFERSRKLIDNHGTYIPKKEPEWNFLNAQYAALEKKLKKEG